MWRLSWGTRKIIDFPIHVQTLGTYFQPRQIYVARERAVLGIEPRTSRTQGDNHITRPNSHVDVGRRSVHVCDSKNILNNESSLHNFAAKLEPLHNGTIHVRLKHRHRIYMKLEFHTIEPNARLSISQCGKWRQCKIYNVLQRSAECYIWCQLHYQNGCRTFVK